MEIPDFDAVIAGCPFSTYRKQLSGNESRHRMKRFIRPSKYRPLALNGVFTVVAAAVPLCDKHQMRLT
tara:strand:+ start:6690 stop:6893 length:204 start_codon:yes stop_codon:yes gene_type:complete